MLRAGNRCSGRTGTRRTARRGRPVASADVRRRRADLRIGVRRVRHLREVAARPAASARRYASAGCRWSQLWLPMSMSPVAIAGAHQSSPSAPGRRYVYSASNVVSIARRASGDAITNSWPTASGCARPASVARKSCSALRIRADIPAPVDEVRKVPHGTVVERERHQHWLVIPRRIARRAALRSRRRASRAKRCVRRTR